MRLTIEEIRSRRQKALGLPTDDRPKNTDDPRAQLPAQPLLGAWTTWPLPGPHDHELQPALLEDDRPYEERKRAALEDIRTLLTIEHMPMYEGLPQRIRVAYRITREMARIRGMVGDDETLGGALVPTAETPDPWLDPRMPTYPLPGRPGEAMVLESVAKIMERAARVPNQAVGGYGGKKRPGLQLIPPGADDPPIMMKLWAEMVGQIGEYLGITSDHTQVGTTNLQLGFWPLMDLECARELWPNPVQIVAWEEALIKEALDTLRSKGIPETQRILKDRHGLLPRESRVLVRLAIQYAQEVVDADVEEQRALMILRLEDFVSRSRQSMELGHELKGLKQLALVQGLGQSDREDTLAQFVSLAQKYDDMDERMIDVKATPKQIGTKNA